MAFIDNIPQFIALLCSLIVTLISLYQSTGFQTICLRVSVVMVIFYTMGLIIRKVLTGIIIDTIDKKQIAREQQMKMDEKQKKASEDDNNEFIDQDSDFSAYPVKELETSEAKIIAEIARRGK